jgi:hypothetical protein
MRALLLDSADAAGGKPLTAAPLAASAGYDEAWLQGLLFDHPGLLPLDLIDPGAGPLVPVCRELPLPNGGTPVDVDILGVTPAGRFVLVECKLWRNPQARREVVGRLLDYAARLRSWRYADLTAQVRARIGHKHANPLFELAKTARPELDDGPFVEAVDAGLARGDLTLIVAGDSIRADVQAITEQIGTPGGLPARLALVELEAWQDGNGTRLIIPHLPFWTDGVTQRALIGADMAPLPVQPASDAVGEKPRKPADADRKARLAANRAFWDRVIDSLSFSHPDQPPARHGGDNWVRVPMPSPCVMTLCRVSAPTSTAIGAFFYFNESGDNVLYSRFKENSDDLQAEIGHPLDFVILPWNNRPGINVSPHKSVQGSLTTDEQIAWLCRVGDRLATAIRTRL